MFCEYCGHELVLTIMRWDVAFSMTTERVFECRNCQAVYDLEGKAFAPLTLEAIAKRWAEQIKDTQDNPDDDTAPVATEGE